MSHDNIGLDTLSAGDTKAMAPTKYQEENNNEVDELSKDFSEMGCIVDAVKRPPNICIETCVYESDSEKSYIEEDAYSDEFEEDKSEDESVKTVAKSVKAETSMETERTVTVQLTEQSSVKLSKSLSSVSSNKAPVSVSGKSSYGSVSVPATRRVNMSFTNDRLREIERHNHILLTKILTARNSRKSSIPAQAQPIRTPVPSAAVTRRTQQRRIDHDNMILLKKIQRAKSSSYSVRR